MTWLRSFVRLMRGLRGENTRLIDRAELLNARQVQLTKETGNYLRDSFYGVRRVSNDG